MRGEVDGKDSDTGTKRQGRKVVDNKGLELKVLSDRLRTDVICDTCKIHTCQKMVRANKKWHWFCIECNNVVKPKEAENEVE